MLHASLRSLASCVLVSLAVALPARAQGTGAIAGTVTAAETARPLDGVRVFVAGTVRAAVTNERGQYRLEGLASGDYEVTATMVGRTPGRERVHVAAGATATADFRLATGSVLLSDIVVSATRTAEPAREVAAPVHTLSREQVRTSPARTTDDLLREMPGVELPRTSSTVSGAEQIVSLRGADEGRTLVLLDGVPLNDPWGEWIQWNRAPRAALDRVEVVEGGGSSLYGNYAMGGLISLYSRPIVARGYDLMASAGSRSAVETSLYGSDVRGRLGVSGGIDYGSGGGYTVLRPEQRGPVDERSEVTRTNLAARAEYAAGAVGTLFASGNYFTDKRQLGTDLTGPNERDLWSGTLGANVGGPFGGDVEARVYGQHQGYDSHSAVVSTDRTTERPNVVQSIPSHDLGGSLQWSRRLGFLESVAVGGDYRYMKGRMDEQVYGSGGTVTGTRTSGGQQQVGGAFVQGVLVPAEPVRIEASARVDGWRSWAGFRETTGTTASDTTYPNKSNAAFAPRVGARWQLHRTLALRGSWYRAFRAPTLSEEYRTFFAGPNTFMGNPELTPEHLKGWDAGFDWQPWEALELRATVFGNDYYDLADFTFKAPSGSGAILQRQNVGHARARGAEGEIALRPLEVLTLAANYTYDDARVVSTDAPVNRVPLQRVAARVTVDSPRLATLNVVYRYEGRNHALGALELAPFAVVDLDVRRELRRGLGVFASVENLLDREYVVNRAGPLESLGLPRTVRGGLTVRSF